MAGPVFVKIRLYNLPVDNIYGDTEEIVIHRNKRTLHGRGDRVNPPYMFEIFWSGTTQAGEELGTAADAAKDGTVVPYQIIVVSTDGNDIDAATGDARKTAVIGLTVPSLAAFNKWLGDSSYTYGAPQLSIEVFNLAGATDVTSSRFYLRVIHGYNIQWGSGGSDAKGTIQIEAPANTVLQTITATYNETNGCILYFPANSEVHIDECTINMPDAALVGQGDGVFVSFVEANFEDGPDPDLPNTYVSCNGYSPNVDVSPVWPLGKDTSATAGLSSLQVLETLVTAAEVASINILAHVHAH